MRLLAIPLLALAACPGPGTGTTDKPPIDKVDRKLPVRADIELPAVPAVIDAQRVEPMTGHDAAAASPVLAVMAEENTRWMKALAGRDPAPAYYLAYAIHDQREVNIEAEGGALIGDRDERDRLIDVDVRVGSPELDNTHRLTKDPDLNSRLERQAFAPSGEDPQAVASALWLETDRRYREAAMQLDYVLADRMVAREKKIAPDFAPATKEVFAQPRATLTFDKAHWVARMKSCSKAALKGVATRGGCSVTFTENTVYFVNSEGSQLQQSWTTAQLAVSVGVKADDGEGLSRFEQRFARSPDKLPGDDEIGKMIDVASADLKALHKAPRVNPWVGPAILEGRATGVWFHEVFGHRIEGHRQKSRTSGKTFAAEVGKQIMPDWLSVYDDPTIDALNGMALNGFYRFDDEGVRAQKVSLVKAGVLEGFLMGRSPIPGFNRSNGHGRRQLGQITVARQGNLVVESARSVPDDQLHQMLIAEIKRQKKPFGMIFTDIKGGFTLTETNLPQAFKVEPVLAYQVFPDGSKKLVRGIDIVGTPLSVLQSFIAAGRSVQTFNGVCGAESGWVPVSASAPALLLERLEVERKEDPSDMQPIMEQP
jgi:predicted Zn-dependent protease